MAIAIGKPRTIQGAAGISGQIRRKLFGKKRK